MANKFHKNLVGDDLHIARTTVQSSTPVGSITPGIIGELNWDSANNKLYIAEDLTTSGWVHSGVGFDTWVELTDTPGTIIANQIVVGNSGATALEFTDTLTLNGTSGLTIGLSIPFADSSGVLTLQNIDALDATTEATIEAAIDTLASLTITGDFTVDTPTFHVDSTNNRVGAGTITPLAILNALGITEQLRLSYDPSEYVTFTVSSTGNLTIMTEGTGSNVTVFADFFPNSVGIGVTTASARLHAVANGGGEVMRLGADITNTNYVVFNVDTSGNLIISPTGERTITRNNTALTNTISNVFKLSHQTSGTPVAGIGVGLEFEVETTASNLEIGAIIENVATDITALSEDFDLVFKTMTAGATATEKMRLQSDGALDMTLGGVFQINGIEILSATALGSSVVGSSLTSVGVLNSGSITSGFGSINVGSSTITTTGTITGPSGTWDSGGIDIATADTYAINSVDVLSATTLGSSVVSSSLTSVGTLASLTITNDLTVDSPTLHVDSTNNRVGVKTITPAVPFHVLGDSVGVGGIIMRLDNSSGTTRLEFMDENGGTGIGPSIDSPSGFGLALMSSGSSSMSFITNGSVAVRMKIVGGDIGIGTSTPFARLHVVSGAGAEHLRLSVSDTQYASFSISSGGDLTITPTGGDTNIVGRFTVDTDTFFVDSDNNEVGIGIASAMAAKLHVVSTTTPLRLGYDLTNFANFGVDSSGNLGITPTNALTLSGTTISLNGTSVLATNLSVDGGVLFVDAVNNKVGINNTSPIGLLDSLGITEQLRLRYDVSNYTSFTVNADGELTIFPTGGGIFLTGGLSISGDLTVTGTTHSINTETVNVADNHFYMNAGYTTVSPETGGLVVNYLPTATVDTMTVGNGNSFVAGVATVSNPTAQTTGAATFSAGDLIQISETINDEHDGLYEVLTHAANLLTIRGVGTTTTVEDFTDNQFRSLAFADATITKVTVSVIRAGTDGIWEIASGSTTGFTFSDLITAASGVTASSVLTDNFLVRGNGTTDIDVGSIFMSSDGNDLTIPGSLQAGDATSDIHSINTAPVATQMLTMSYTEAAANTSAKGIFQNFIHSSDNSSAITGSALTIDHDISGTATSTSGGKVSMAIEIDQDDATVMSAANNEHEVFGQRITTTFSGSVTAGSLLQYGLLTNVTGNIGTAGQLAEKFGLHTTVIGTADTSYGVLANVLGATTNYGVYINDAAQGGFVADFDNVLNVLLGEGQDSSIGYDGTNLVFNSQVVGSGDYTFLGGDVAVGHSSALAKLDVISATTQMRVGFDVSNFATFGVDSSGNLGITPSNSLNLNGTTVTLAGDVQMGTLTVDGGVLFVDATNNKVGINTSGPIGLLESFGITEQLRLAYDGSNHASFTVSSSGDLTIDPTGNDTTIGGETLTVQSTSDSGTLGRLNIFAPGVPTSINVPSIFFGRSNAVGNTAKLQFTRMVDTTQNLVRLGFHSAESALVLKFNGNIAFNHNDPQAALHTILTTEQLRLGYDASNYASFTTNSGGDLTIAPTGGTLTVTGDLSVSGSVVTDTYKESVAASAIANGTLATDFENGDTLDGFTLSTGDRIILPYQTAASENGIYTVNATGSPTRSTDFDSGSEVLGSVVYVLQGTVFAGVSFRLTNTTTPTIGSTSLVFKDNNDVENLKNIHLPVDLGTATTAPDGISRVLLVGGITYLFHNNMTIPRLRIPPVESNVPTIVFTSINLNIVLFCAGDDTGHIWGRNMHALDISRISFLDSSFHATRLFDLAGTGENTVFVINTAVFINFNVIGSAISFVTILTSMVFSNCLGGLRLRTTVTNQPYRFIGFRAKTSSSSPTATTRPMLTFQGSPKSILLTGSPLQMSSGDDIFELDSALTSDVSIGNNAYGGTSDGNFFQTTQAATLTAQANADVAFTSIATGATGFSVITFSAAQDFTIGQIVLIDGDTGSTYDGLQTITAVSDNLLDYTIAVTFIATDSGNFKMVKHTMSSNPFSRDGTVTTAGTTSYNETSIKVLRETSTTIHLPQAFVADDTTGLMTSNPKNEATVGVNALNNGAQKDSTAVGLIVVIDNTTATTISTIDTWTDLNLGASAFAGSTNERFTITNTTTGEVQYDGDKPLNNKTVMSLSAVSSGGSQLFKFRSVVNGTAISDGIEPSVELGSDTGNISLVVPLGLVQNDLHRVQVKNVDGTSNVTIQDISGGP